MNHIIEIQRNNVTLSQFLSYVRGQCKKKGIPIDINKEEFENPHSSQLRNSRYIIIDGVKISHIDGYIFHKDVTGLNNPFISEILAIEPLGTQTYILDYVGNCYNEICEFTYDDKTGHGYYYKVDKYADV